jgi:hypothetical protein
MVLDGLRPVIESLGFFWSFDCLLSPESSSWFCSTPFPLNSVGTPKVPAGKTSNPELTFLTVLFTCSSPGTNGETERDWAGSGALELSKQLESGRTGEWTTADWADLKDWDLSLGLDNGVANGSDVS